MARSPACSTGRRDRPRFPVRPRERLDSRGCLGEGRRTNCGAVIDAVRSGAPVVLRPASRHRPPNPQPNRVRCETLLPGEPAVTDLTLHAQSRTTFGKGAARKIRRAHQVPAVMYGHGTDPVHITLPGHDTMLALNQPNALLTIVLDGNEQLALAKDV